MQAQRQQQQQQQQQQQRSAANTGGSGSSEQRLQGSSTSTTDHGVTTPRWLQTMDDWYEERMEKERMARGGRPTPGWNLQRQQRQQREQQRQARLRQHNQQHQEARPPKNHHQHHHQRRPDAERAAPGSGSLAAVPGSSPRSPMGCAASSSTKPAEGGREPSPGQDGGGSNPKLRAHRGGNRGSFARGGSRCSERRSEVRVLTPQEQKPRQEREKEVPILYQQRYEAYRRKRRQEQEQEREALLQKNRQEREARLQRAREREDRERKRREQWRLEEFQQRQQREQRWEDEVRLAAILFECNEKQEALRREYTLWDMIKTGFRRARSKTEARAVALDAVLRCRSFREAISHERAWKIAKQETEPAVHMIEHRCRAAFDHSQTRWLKGVEDDLDFLGSGVATGLGGPQRRRRPRSVMWLYVKAIFRIGERRKRKLKKKEEAREKETQPEGSRAPQRDLRRESAVELGAPRPPLPPPQEQEKHRQQLPPRVSLRVCT